VTIISTSRFRQKHLFNEVADTAQFDLVNSRTFKDLWNKIQGLSSTCPVFKYFQGLEFTWKKFKHLQRLSRMHGNSVFYRKAKKLKNYKKTTVNTKKTTIKQKQDQSS